mmetsp:Transcript_34012/g.33169  ORF Transcript_34012/g.33169 Transcript_34012/m.33169 type:complete len:217 (+) Transcript_34012:2046-2696(+)
MDGGVVVGGGVGGVHDEGLVELVEDDPVGQHGGVGDGAGARVGHLLGLQVRAPRVEVVRQRVHLHRGEDPRHHRLLRNILDDMRRVFVEIVHHHLRPHPEVPTPSGHVLHVVRPVVVVRVVATHVGVLVGLRSRAEIVQRLYPDLVVVHVVKALVVCDPICSHSRIDVGGVGASVGASGIDHAQPSEGVVASANSVLILSVVVDEAVVGVVHAEEG